MKSYRPQPYTDIEIVGENFIRKASCMCAIDLVTAQRGFTCVRHKAVLNLDRKKFFKGVTSATWDANNGLKLKNAILNIRTKTASASSMM